MFILAANDYLNCYNSFERIAFNIPNLEGFVTKSITSNPRIGNKLPHFYSKDNYVLVSSGLCNPGLDKILPDIQKYINQFKSGPTIVPSVACDPDSCNDPILELTSMIERLYDTGVKNIEVNLACPNVKHEMDIYKFTDNLLTSIVNLGLKINIIPKITTSNSNELINLIVLIKKYEINNISFAPFMPAVMLDKDMHPVLGNIKGVVCGGMNGFTTRSLLFDACKKVNNVYLIASGGCLSSSKNTLEDLLYGYNQTLTMGAYGVSSVAPFWDFSEDKIHLLQSFVNNIKMNKSLLFK